MTFVSQPLQDQEKEHLTKLLAMVEIILGGSNGATGGLTAAMVMGDITAGNAEAKAAAKSSKKERQRKKRWGFSRLARHRLQK
jgi:hypothetical protein